MNTNETGNYQFYPNANGTSWVNPTPAPIIHNHYVTMPGVEEILARFNRITLLLDELAARIDALAEKVEAAG